MEDFKVVIFIMIILVALSAVADRTKLPSPILMVAAGLIIGFVPSLPDLSMDPVIVFLIFLPPLLYDAASKTSWHEFRSSIRPISALAITLVFFTTIAVAVAAHYLIPGFSWPLSFVLGAIVSPPDAVAATSIIKGLGLHKKVITILEGESLLNDASALIAYRYAVATVTTGTFVLWQASVQFLIVAGCGILIGIACGYIFVFVHKRINNNSIVETSLTLLYPFVAYLIAEHFHVSGILAVVSTGLVISWRAPEIFSYQARMRTRIVWDTVIYLLNGFIFILIGLQLPLIIKELGNYPVLNLLGNGLLISLVTIVVRIVWVFAGAYWQNLSIARKKTSDDNEEIAWKNVLIVAWTGT
ncbi:MAG: cation:proton antiporter, partial [Panacibacter sp.]